MSANQPLDWLRKYTALKGAVLGVGRTNKVPRAPYLFETALSPCRSTAEAPRQKREKYSRTEETEHSVAINGWSTSGADELTPAYLVTGSPPTNLMTGGKVSSQTL